ncbi:MAG: cupin domain-containing protein [Candidatus Phaeomarinobacter sp.]
MSGNLFSDLPKSALADEQFNALLENGPVKIERIVSTGQTAPDTGWFDQEQDEWVCVLDGEAHLEIENGATNQLKTGDWMLLPAHCRHRVTYTRKTPPTVWLAVHIYPARR